MDSGGWYIGSSGWFGDGVVDCRIPNRVNGLSFGEYGGGGW